MKTSALMRINCQREGSYRDLLGPWGTYPSWGEWAFFRPPRAALRRTQLTRRSPSSCATHFPVPATAGHRSLHGAHCEGAPGLPPSLRPEALARWGAWLLAHAVSGVRACQAAEDAGQATRDLAPPRDEPCEEPSFILAQRLVLDNQGSTSVIAGLSDNRARERDFSRTALQVSNGLQDCLFPAVCLVRV